MWENHKKKCNYNTILIDVIESSPTSRLGKCEIFITSWLVTKQFDVWQILPEPYHQ